MKKCNACGLEKSDDLFRKNRRVCKLCSNIRNRVFIRNHYKNNLGKKQQQNLEFRLANPEYFEEYNRKRRELSKTRRDSR